MSDASGTLWLDVRQRIWSDELLSVCHLGRARMPRLVEGSEVSGRLRPALAARWGLRSALAVAGGGGDNAASAIGVGAVLPRQGFVSLSVGRLLLVGEGCAIPPLGSFCHALPQRWHQISVMLSAERPALGLQPARHRLRPSCCVALVARAAGARELHLPALLERRSDAAATRAQGVLFGLNHGHDAQRRLRRRRGVSFSLFDGWLTWRRDAVSPVADRRWRTQRLVGAAAGNAPRRHDGRSRARRRAWRVGAARLAWLATAAMKPGVRCLPPVRIRSRCSEASLLGSRRRFVPHPALRERFQCRRREAPEHCCLAGTEARSSSAARR